MSDNANMKLLNLGCGHISPDGWTNVDGSNRAWLASKLPWLDRFLTRLNVIDSTEFSKATVHADLTKRFPWQDNTIDGIYMGEILEHFTKDDGEEVLRECYRVLKPGGTLRVRVPDFVEFCEKYIAEYREVQSLGRQSWNDKHSRWVKMFFDDICVVSPKRFRSFGHFHKWMYDDISLILLMERLGFRDAMRRKLHESQLPLIDKVESRELLVVEAVK
jgi:predicted SAM-dependent methyltransferase